MTVRSDDHIEKFLDVDGIRSREELRKFMLCTYAVEDCGVKVRYYVETLSNGKRIYVERPTFLNKGCDFVLFAEDVIVYHNGNDKAPSHNDIIEELAEKKRALTSEQYASLSQAIDRIYNVASYEDAAQFVKGLPEVGWSYELVLKLLRWLFIEQDITYWAGTGREMLMIAIQNIE
ncbi:MAG: hypothetical protein MJZ82_01270 [Paludibacteraceae bacterium]|nr:hypothetical protein [Paludibacteraceae bacterium]